MKTLAIIGSGDLGMQIAHYAITDQHYENVVFFDDFSEVSSKNGFNILGKTQDILNQYHQQKFDELIIGIGYKHLDIRRKLFEEYNHKVPFGKIIHSSCWVDNSAQIYGGSVVYPRCTIDAGAIIDCNTILNLGCTIAHDTKVGKHSFLSPSVALAGFVNVGEQCILGINSTIIDNLTISNKVQIGGGTVVIKNLEKPGLYVGNPQKFIR